MAEAKVENKYERGKIYKLYNIQEPEKFYIGITIQELSERFSKHKSAQGNDFIHQEIRRIGSDKFDIELIEPYPCNNWDELHVKEERVRKQLKPFYNMVRAYRTEEERKEQHNQESAKYYQNNKEHISQYWQKNKKKRAQHNAKYWESKKEKISQQRAEQYRRKVCSEVLNDIISKIENNYCYND
jgi:transketolase